MEGGGKEGPGSRIQARASGETLKLTQGHRGARLPRTQEPSGSRPQRRLAEHCCTTPRVFKVIKHSSNQCRENIADLVSSALTHFHDINFLIKIDCQDFPMEPSFTS